MKIFYRISKYLSSNPNPLGKDKTYILETCLNSFLIFAPHSDITFIVDSLEPSWVEKRLKPYGSVVNGHNGNVETFHDQINLVCNLPNEENVMLVEDDYLWRPDSLNDLILAVDELALVSPYDHPGHYTEERFKYTPKQMRLVWGQVYRQAPSNTLTFACKAWVIKQNQDLIKSFGIRDHEIFQALGIDLWVPIPSMATHLVTGLIAPSFLENPLLVKA